MIFDDTDFLWDADEDFAQGHSQNQDDYDDDYYDFEGPPIMSTHECECEVLRAKVQARQDDYDEERTSLPYDAYDAGACFD
jgi:hypothetical protein